MSETIEVMQPSHQNESWAPVLGDEFLRLRDSLELPQESKDFLTQETTRILAKCVPPSFESGGKTGLVFGYVQSGKTLSFTAVSALARDNDFPILIVIAGTSVPLSEQSVQRLRTDLKIEEYRHWVQLTNPRGKASAEEIYTVIENWRDPSTKKEDRQTVLITVMKNHTHLRNLIDVLGTLDLARIPTLIVDDEADQASLNTKPGKQDEESSTYSKLMELCRKLPHYTYLQYTATPQAPLLISIIDNLSPSFVEVLTPGPGYAGGKRFFHDRKELIHLIPQFEIPEDGLQEPPESLMHAMQIFYLGAATGFVNGDHHKSSRTNRSMLIHPSHKTDSHFVFHRWVESIRDRWVNSLSVDDEDKLELLSEFNVAYEDLKQTLGKDLPAFELLQESLKYTIRNTHIQVINAAKKGKTPKPDWKKYYSHILIGGQAMDRGYTIEGLTVTYMPRGMGVGNSDTIQQRARFFGYKEKYLGFCRIFLDAKMREAFKEYVEFEEDLRSRLAEYTKNGKSLSEWIRAFFIADFLKPTRRNVLLDSYERGKFSNKWFAPKVPYGSDETNERNRKLIDEFVKSFQWSRDEAHPTWTEDQRHAYLVDVPLQRVYDDVLIKFLVTNDGDSGQYIGMMMQIKQYLKEYPDATCSMYSIRMESSPENWVFRERAINSKNKIDLFQGRDPGAKPGIYPGDQKIGNKNKDDVIIQFHKLRIFKDREHTILAVDNIRTIAVWIPKKLEKSWIVQKKS